LIENTNDAKKIELLAPAGNPESLDAAIGEGADAVYLGMKEFNARLRTKNFSFGQIEALTYKLHDMNKKIFVALNIVFEERESERIYQLLKYLEAVGVDAVIVQDTGIIKMINAYFPTLKIHASTQMNVSSSKGVNFLSKHGVSRVVLSRECSLEEIKMIRAQTNVELEVFVHGALCISYSGLCLFSSFFGGKSANRGACTQACRRLYNSRKGDGYYFSPDDLCLADFVPDFMKMGITSLKIEGRMRSAEYVGRVVRGYRYLIDNYHSEGIDAVIKAKEILENDYARKKTIFYINGNAAPDFLKPDKTAGTGLYLGKIDSIRTEKDRIYCGAKKFSSLNYEDSIRVHSADDSIRKAFKVVDMFEDSGMTYINTSADFKVGDTVYLIQSKEDSTRYMRVIPNNLDKYKKHPMRLKPPVVPKVSVSKIPYPSGIYVKTDKVSDLYIIQSVKPEMVIFHLNSENANELLGKRKTLPFRPEEILIYLDPFIPESVLEQLSATVGNLGTAGYAGFIANNLSGIQILKGAGISNIIAGPFLYSFNSYSTAFLTENGINAVTLPLEISKNNLNNIIEKVDPKVFFITVFSFPQLFQINTSLTRLYDFENLSDKDGYQFIFKNYDKDKTAVVCETPFSIIDKIGQLRKDGIRRFIVDLAFTDLKKSYYKDLMDIVKSNGIFQGASRFNWKDGFYNKALHTGTVTGDKEK